MASPDTIKRISDVLEHETQLAAWLRRHQLETMLTGKIRSLLPKLVATQTRVVDMRGGQLKLSVSSGAVATAVKQYTPEILQFLSQQGYEFNAVFVSVQPIQHKKITEKSSVPRTPPPVSALRDFEATLPDGKLKNALQRLIKNC
jgi:Uncharacterized protein conserved in bacteria